MGNAQVKAQRLANEANLQIAKENNELQMELHNSQNEWNLEQWERENEYNSPENQIKRLQDAGLNPLVAFGASNPSGVASSPAVGDTPPQLVSAHVEPEYQSPMVVSSAFNQIANAFKNFGDFGRSMQEQGLGSMQLSFVRDMALKGYNPELIKAKTSLEMFNQLVTSGKYQPYQIQAIIRDFNTRADYQAVVKEERKQVINNLRAEFEGIQFNNKFNAGKAPLELAKLYSDVVATIQGVENQTNLTAAQINAANASANLSSKQAGLVESQTALVDEQTQQARYDTALHKLRSGLANMGINPDDKHVPFFIGIGEKLVNKELDPMKVTDFFEAVSNAEKNGWNTLYENGANLSRFQLYGEQSGPMGLNGMFEKASTDVKSFFNQIFK